MADSQAQTGTVRVAVWDPWVRLAHWLMVALILISWASAEYGYGLIHRWSGGLFLTVLLFRLMWGVVGSSTARFNCFVRGPRGVLGYLSRSHDWRFVGHTPLGALSVVTMLGLLTLQVTMGLILADESGRAAGPLARLVDPETAAIAWQLHHSLFNLLLWFIALHLGAILFYRLFRRRRLTSAMIHGEADYPAGTPPMRPAPPRRALACLGIAAVLTAWLFAGMPPFGG